MTQLIVALDGMTFQEAQERQVLSILSEACTRELVWGVKINDMLYSGDAPGIISQIRQTYHLAVMVDVKLHDIPNTMENSLRRLTGAGADIVTIHCSSNYRPKNADLLQSIAGVTTLTSFTDLEIKWIYDKTTEDIVKAFADIALMNQYAYIVCSVKDLGYIQDNPLRKICTGIRPSWWRSRNDQVRVASVKEAVRMEADYIILGRPIIQSENVMEAIEKINAEIS